MGEPQVPTTFERSASAAEYPPAGAGFQRKPLVHQNKKGTPAGAIFFILVDLTGIEPATLRMRTVRSPI